MALTNVVVALVALVACLVVGGNAYLVQRYQGPVSNSWILTTPTATLVIDAQSSSDDGLKLAQYISAQGFATPPTIFITHGHPDHFSGLPGITSVFPGATIYVASQQVKDSVIGFVAAANPPLPADVRNFDYADRLQITGESLNVLDVPLEVRAGYVNTEASIESLVADPISRRVFVGDLLYDSTHLYLGAPLTLEWVLTWLEAQRSIADRYDGFTVYPGHGSPSTKIQNLADQDQRYIDEFFSQLCSKPLSEVPDAMVKAFPTYDGAFITAVIAANPAWFNVRAELSCSAASALTATTGIVVTLLVTLLGMIC